MRTQTKLSKRHKIKPSPFRRRYAEHRFDDVEYSQLGAHREYLFGETENWKSFDVANEEGDDVYDEDYLYDFIYDGARGEDFHWYELEVFLESLLGPAMAPIAPDPTISREAEDSGASIRQPEPRDLEKKLASYELMLADVQNHSHKLRAQIRSAFDKDQRDIEVLRKAFGDDDSRLKHVCLFAPFWVRRPSTWDSEQEPELLNHLFVLYEVPAFLYEPWSCRWFGFKWMCWFILLGQGGSLKRASPFFHWRIPGRFEHFLRQAPEGLEPVEAAMYAEVRRLGGTETVFRHLLRHNRLRLDPTYLSHEYDDPRYEPGLFYWFAYHRSLWSNTVRWLARYEPELSDREIDSILKWMLNQCGNEGTKFSWKKRTPGAIRKRFEAEERRRQRLPWRGLEWHGRGWDWTWKDPKRGVFTFTELTTGEALFEEGRSMGHSVVKLASQCSDGTVAVWSMKHEGQAILTVALYPRPKRIYQIKGEQHRDPTLIESWTISKWLRVVVRQTSST